MAEIIFEGEHDIVRTGVRKVLLHFKDHRQLTWRKAFGGDICIERGVEWLVDDIWYGRL